MMAELSLVAAIAVRMSEVVIEDKPRDQYQRISKKSIQEVILKNKDVDYVPALGTWRNNWHKVMDRMNRANAAEESHNHADTLLGSKVSKTEVTILDGGKVKAVAQMILAGEPEFHWKTQPKSSLEIMEAAILLDLALEDDTPIEFGWSAQWDAYWNYRSHFHFDEFAKAWQIVATHLEQTGQLLVSGGTESGYKHHADIVPQYLVLKNRDKLAEFDEDPLAFLASNASDNESGRKARKVNQITFTQLSKQWAKKGARTIGYVQLSEKSQAENDYRMRLHNSGATEVFVDRASGFSVPTPEWNRLMAQVKAGDTIIVPGLKRMPDRGAKTEEVIFELLNHEVNLRVYGVGALIEFRYGELTRDSRKLLKMYYAMLELLPEIAEKQIDEAIEEYKEK